MLGSSTVEEHGVRSGAGDFPETPGMARPSFSSNYVLKLPAPYLLPDFFSH